MQAPANGKPAAPAPANPQPAPPAPPRLDLLGAAMRFWPLVLIPTLLLASAALFVATERAPTYTAEARLIVGGFDVSSRSIPGFAEATQSLAQTYSRSISADGVVRPVARRLRSSPGAVRERLAASSIPDSAVLRVEATGTSEAGARRLANTAAQGLIRYVTRLGAESARTAPLLRDYRRAARRLSAGQADSERLRRSLQLLDLRETRRQLEQASVEIQAARLEIQALTDIYSLRRQSSQESEVLNVLSLSTGATSDRSSFLQRLLFVGAAAGLLVGLALAAALDVRRPRRVR